MSLEGGGPRWFTPSIVGMLLLALLYVVPGAEAFDQSNSLFTRVLANHVRGGLVDYGEIRADPRDLDAYLAVLSAVGRTEFEGWSKADQLAFLINLYNAHTLRLIVDDYPVKSIKDIRSFIRGPWDQPVVQLFRRLLLARPGRAATPFATRTTIGHSMISGASEAAARRMRMTGLCATDEQKSQSPT